MEEVSRYSNYYDNVTTLHPLAVGMLIVAAIAVFAVPRRQIFFPIIMLTVLVPAAQRVVIFGADFHFLRLMTVFAWLRVLARGENRPLKMTPLDWAMVAWPIARLLAGVARKGSFGILVNQAGQGFDALGVYFLARTMIRSWKDLDALVLSFIWASIPIAALSTYEVLSHRNPFYIFGQAVEQAIMRDGRVRARGAFSHQILAGAYWVAVLPLIVARCLQPRKLVSSLVGVVCCIVPIINCSSSTPILGAGIAGIAGGFYVLRKKMRLVRWGMVAGLVLIQLSMSKPIWHLLHRAGAIGLGASTGYHRYRLIDAFVSNFKKWALVGVNSTASWGRQLEDTTNHFIVQGVQGGLVTFLIFIAIFVFTYRQAGQIIAASERSRLSFYAWGLGCCIVAHTAMMFATSYFGQILFPWYVTFGVIGSLSVAATSRGGVSAPPRKARETPPAPPRARRRTPEPASPGRLADLLG